MNDALTPKDRPHPALIASLVGLTTAIWAANFLVAKAGLKQLAPLTLASFRVVLAGLIMVPIYRARRKAAGAPSGKSARLGSRDLWTFAYLGFFGVVTNQVCFTVGLAFTSVGHSSLIIAMGPIFILLFARLGGMETLTSKKVLGMAVSFTGVALLAAEHGLSLRSGTFLGDVITLCGSLGFSLYAVLGKKVARKYDSVTMNAFNYFAGALLVAPLAIRQALALTRAGGWGSVNWKGWAAVVYMAGFASVLAYLIYFWLLRHLAASRLGSFSYLLPVVATTLGILVLGEKLTGTLLVGGGLVLLGLGVTESAAREHKLGEEPILN